MDSIKSVVCVIVVDDYYKKLNNLFSSSFFVGKCNEY